jgi:hypothetical protein
VENLDSGPFAEVAVQEKVASAQDTRRPLDLFRLCDAFAQPALNTHADTSHGATESVSRYIPTGVASLDRAVSRIDDIRKFGVANDGCNPRRLEKARHIIPTLLYITDWRHRAVGSPRPPKPKS